MSNFQQKVTRPQKKNKKVWLTHRKNKSNQEELYLNKSKVGILDKNLKQAILNMLKELKEIIFKLNK